MTDAPENPSRSVLRLAEPALLGILAVLYAASAPSWVLGGDTGEFATLVVTDGVAHPPGYPLYAMLLRSMGWLTAWLTPAHIASLVSAALGVAAVGMAMLAARWYGASRWASLVAAATLGVAPLMWTLSTQPEVFSLNALLAAAIVGFASSGAPLRGVRRGALLGLLAGLALANHHSAVLLIPIGLTGALRSVREARPRSGAIALGLCGLVAGLLPYLWLLAADGAWQWGDLDSPGALFHHILRSDYGTTGLSAHGHVVPAEQLAFFARSVASNLLWLGALVGLLGMIVALRTPGPRRTDGAALLGAWLLVGPVFVAALDVPPYDVGVLVVERFHLMAVVLSSVFVALGLDALWRPLDTRLQPRQPRQKRLAAGLLVATVLGLGVAHSLPRVRQAHAPAVHHYVLNTLEMLPEDALVLGTGDHVIFGMLYAQVALGLRPDVVYVDLEMLPYPWYHERIEARLGTSLDWHVRDATLDETSVVAAALATGRPVFLTAVRDAAIIEGFAIFPLGGVVGVAPPDMMPPPPDELARHNHELYENFELGYPFPTEPGTWAADVHRRYADNWIVLAGALELMGKPKEAEKAWQRARTLAPWLLE